MHWILFGLTALFFLFTPYEYGLFFERVFYKYEIILNVLFLIFLLYLWLNQKGRELSWNLLIFLIPFAFFLSFFVAETPFGALQHVLRWIAYGSFFLVFWWSIRREEVRRWVPYLFVLTGTWIALHALLGFYGIVQFEDVVLSNRLAGVFQYPNALASVIGAVWLFCLFQLTKSKLKWWEVAVYSLPTVLFGFVFLYTYSRGAWLVFPVAWWLGALFIGWNRQWKLVLYSAVSGISSFLVFRAVERGVEEKAAYAGSVSLLMFTIVVSALIFAVYTIHHRWLDEKMEAWGRKPLTRFIAPVLAVIAGFLLVADIQSQGWVYKHLPQTVQNRVDTINFETSSVVGRTTFYKDALEMLDQSPVLGLGGDGWRILFTQYQDSPYLSREIHNGYLEWLLSTGWLGTVLISLTMLFFFVQIARGYALYRQDNEQSLYGAGISALAMLMLHAAIDFDFSYATIWIWIWL